jgi:hypothetical protein
MADEDGDELEGEGESMLVAYIPSMISSLVAGFAGELLLRPAHMVMYRLLLQGSGIKVRDALTGVPARRRGALHA